LIQAHVNFWNNSNAEEQQTDEKCHLAKKDNDENQRGKEERRNSLPEYKARVNLRGVVWG